MKKKAKNSSCQDHVQEINSIPETSDEKFSEVNAKIITTKQKISIKRNEISGALEYIHTVAIAFLFVLIIFM